MTTPQVAGTLRAGGRGARSPRRSAPLTPRAAATRVLFLAPFFVPFAAFYLVPIGYAIWQSTLRVERTGGIFGHTTNVFAGFGQYVSVLTSTAFQTGMLRLVLFAIIQVPVMLAIAVVLALLLDVTVPRLGSVLRGLYFMPYAVPGVIAALMWGALYLPSTSPLTDLGIRIDLLGSTLVLPALANIGIWAYAGYNVVLMVSALTSVPQELFEAARMDGASDLRIALSIKLPLIRSTVIMAAIFNTIGTLQTFTEPQVLRSITSSIDSGFTPNMLAYNAAANNDYSFAAAASVTLALITFVVSFFFLRVAQRSN